MRQKHKNILPGFFNGDENETKTPKIVRLFREEYKRFDDYLKKYPEITELDHRDLMKLCKPNPKRNRTPDFTTENLFRAVLVMQVEAVPYREAVVRILVKNSYKTLIERTGEAVTKAKRIAAILLASGHAIAASIGVELSSFFPAMDKVVDAARRRHDGEKVPVEDKVFSIFESHTELIQRGKRDKPIEFGHKIVLSETVDKFITDYQVFLKSPSDTKLLEEVVERHRELFRKCPLGVAADMAGNHYGIRARRNSRIYWTNMRTRWNTSAYRDG